MKIQKKLVKFLKEAILIAWFYLIVDWIVANSEETSQIRSYVIV